MVATSSQPATTAHVVRVRVFVRVEINNTTSEIIPKHAPMYPASILLDIDRDKSAIGLFLREFTA